MPSFTSTVDIMAPAPIVWDVLTDVERWGDWMHDVKSVTTQTPNGGVGTVSSRITYRLSTPGAGTTRVECDYELSGVGGTIASLTGTMQGQLDKEMDALKERCEQAS